MTAVYLAGPYAARERLKAMAKDLEAMLVEVTASWIDETHDITPGTLDAATDLTDEQVARHAATDLDDIADADLLVLITAEIAGILNATSGGRHVETGYAIASGIPVLVVGEPENVFHRIGPDHNVWVCADWPTAVGLIAAHEVGDERGCSITWAEALT